MPEVLTIKLEGNVPPDIDRPLAERGQGASPVPPSASPPASMGPPSARSLQDTRAEGAAGLVRADEQMRESLARMREEMASRLQERQSQEAAQKAAQMPVPPPAEGSREAVLIQLREEVRLAELAAQKAKQINETYKDPEVIALLRDRAWQERLKVQHERTAKEDREEIADPAGFAKKVGEQVEKERRREQAEAIRREEEEEFRHRRQWWDEEYVFRLEREQKLAQEREKQQRYQEYLEIARQDPTFRAREALQAEQEAKARAAADEAARRSVDPDYNAKRQAEEDLARYREALEIASLDPVFRAREAMEQAAEQKRAAAEEEQARKLVDSEYAWRKAKEEVAEQNRAAEVSRRRQIEADPDLWAREQMAKEENARQLNADRDSARRRLDPSYDRQRRQQERTQAGRPWDDAGMRANQAMQAAGGIATAASSGTGIGAITAVTSALSAIPGPAGAAAMAFGAAANAVGGFIEGINKQVEKYAAYSPELAQAKAQAEINRIMGDIDRAQKMGPELAKFVEEQSKLEQSWEDTKMELMKTFLPVIIDILEAIKDLQPLLQLLGKTNAMGAKALGFMVDPIGGTFKFVKGLFDETERHNRSVEGRDLVGEMAQILLESRPAAERGDRLGAGPIGGGPRFPNPFGGF